jgi:two-component system, chemotaxis family, chemotaxis protein CheY
VNPGADPSPARKTLLVVDDDSDVRDVLQEVLEDAGYAVICVEHGEEALAYLQIGPLPDAILLDLFMPVMSGWDFARHVRRYPHLAAIPIVVITCSEPYWGYPGPHVLRKPLDLEKLLATVGSLLQGRSGGPPGSNNGSTGSRRTPPALPS